jgi:hypothetical protein
VRHEVPEDEVKEFWETMWKAAPEEPRDDRYDQYLLEYDPGDEEPKVFPTLEEFQRIITHLPKWKAAGCDGIYNFFISSTTALHCTRS